MKRVGARRVYFLRPVGQDGPVKIGCSDYPEGRLTSCMAHSPVPIELAVVIPGDETLERRFHAKFEQLRSHNEWFLASPELVETVAAVVAGTFDFDSLPLPKRLKKAVRSAEANRAIGYANRLRRLEKSGVVIPPHVREATFTYRCDSEEVERRRAIIREFVDAAS